MTGAQTPDLIARLRTELTERTPVDDREAAGVAEVLGALETLATPFDEDADPLHLTASAIVTGPRGVCLHRHKRLGIWLQPGGHVDPGEAPWTAALRETAEETGLHGRLAQPSPEGGARIAHIDVHDAPKGHRHLDLRYLVHADGDPVPAPGESPDVAWFAWSQAISLADAGLRSALIALRPSV